jgi:YesN/AraC family two-component response regulator
MQQVDGQSLLAGYMLSRPDAVTLIAGLRDAFLCKMRTLDEREAENALERYIAALKETVEADDVRLAWLSQLALRLMEHAAEQGIRTAENICSSVCECKDTEHAHKLLKSYMLGIIRERERLTLKPARYGSLAVEYMGENYMRNLSIKDMTSRLAVGSSYFSAMFKGYTGMTFTAYLTGLRLEKAKELLVATDKKNYEVAAAVGYDDPGYFRQVFKKHLRLTPSEYRKEHSNKKESR